MSRGRLLFERTFSLPTGNADSSLCTRHCDPFAYLTQLTLALTEVICGSLLSLLLTHLHSTFQYDRGGTDAHVLVLDRVLPRRVFPARYFRYSNVMFWLKFLFENL